MKLIGFTCTYNEEDMIPYVMPYVERMGYDKFIVYDNESTDNTVELLKQYPFVEVRTYKTNGAFDNSERIKLAYTVYGEAYNLARVGREDEELVWLTVTDFDEVLFISSKTAVSVKDFLEYRYRAFGENYFNEMMINLLPPMDSDGNELLKNKYVHLSKNIRANYWTIYGNKTTMFAVNDFPFYQTCKGFHWTKFKIRKNKEEKNISVTGEVFGFHLKYIDKNMLTKKHDEYKKRQVGYRAKDEFIFESLYTSSFPLENHFMNIPMLYNLTEGADSGIIVVH